MTDFVCCANWLDERCTKEAVFNVWFNTGYCLEFHPYTSLCLEHVVEALNDINDYHVKCIKLMDHLVETTDLMVENVVAKRVDKALDEV